MDNTISFPSGVHTGPEVQRPDVTGLGSPLGLKSVERSSRYRSPDTPQREKANVCPSGETAGPQSPALAGAEVSLCFLRVSTEYQNRLSPLPLSLSIITSERESGDQASRDPRKT